MIHVELIGCTSAGKSTLTKALIDVCLQRNLRAATASELILERSRLSNLHNPFLKERVIDFVAFVGYVRRRRRYRRLIAFSVSAISGLSIGLASKLNTLRNVVRKIGIAEVVQELAKDHDIVFVDNDGVLQAAHNLFVHVTDEPDESLVSEFARLSPIPSVAVYLRHGVRVLESRTLARGHKRIPDRSAGMTGLFVRRAVDVFEKLCAEPSVSRNLVVVEGQQRMEVRPIQGGGAEVNIVAELVKRAAAEVSSYVPATPAAQF